MASRPTRRIKRSNCHFAGFEGGEISSSMNVAQSPLLSIVLPFHNPGSDLSRAIKSVLWQTLPDWELLLLDDGSSDGAAEQVKKFRDSRIRLISQKVRSGLPNRLNHGVQLTRGKYIARMDADDVCFPERLERQITFLESNQSVDLLAASVLVVNSQNDAVGVLSCGKSHREICRRPYHGFPMPHPTWMGRADWFKSHPYSEEAVRCEDQALLLNTCESSLFAGLDDVLLAYKVTGLSLKKSLTGRINYLRALARQHEGKNLILGGFSHSMAFVRDFCATILRMDQAATKAKTTEPSLGFLENWKKLSLVLDDG